MKERDRDDRATRVASTRGGTMIYTLAVILFVAWLLGFGVFHVGGGLIHTLLVLAVIVILWRVITGRRPIA
jgi:hypothetical protein